jgi:DNA-directed RNA polymerase I, II, and III subunit RPABC2
LKESWYLSSTPEPKVVETPEHLESTNSDEVEESEIEANVGLGKALATYRKLAEGGKDAEPLSEKQEEVLVNRLTEIENREIIDSVVEHEPIEIPCEKGKITIGPPKLTRFEKARIMGARALQLSLGAPPFIPIPKTARISLDISMAELEAKVIPITIRRVLPNGDYQNIPINYFD